MLRKQKTRAWLLSLAAVVLLMSNYFVGWAEEPDPRILWVADSSIKFIDGFAVHPNGNIFAYHGSNIVEIDGTNGKLLRKLPKFSKDDDIESLDISNDGKYLAISFNEIIIIDLSDLSSKVIGYGNPVRFTSDSKNAIFSPQSPAKPGEGSDSTLVLVNLENDERKPIKNDEGIGSFAFSPDGRYFATGGIGKNIDDKYYTTLKLWDAKTLTMIKELARYNSNNPIKIIQFSPDSKFVAFNNRSADVVSIFDTDGLAQIKHYKKDTYGDYMTGFSWIDSSSFVILSKSITICNVTDEIRKVIYHFPDWGNQIETDFINNRLITRTGIPHLGGLLISWDLKIALSNNTESPLNSELKSEYQKGILLLSGINSSNNSVNLEIFDINGKLIRQLNAVPNGTEIRIPIILPKGTYLLNLNDGNKKYSSKFLVTE